MTRQDSPLETVALWLLGGSLALVQLNLAASETLLALAGLIWVALAVRDGQRPSIPAFFVPLAGLALWTLVSTAVSPDPMAGLREDKQLLLYAIVPITMRLARGSRSQRVVTWIIAVGGLSAFAGIVQGIIVGNLNYDYLIHNRPHGLLGHYMTYSGVLMLVFGAAVAQLIYAEQEWIWPAVAVPALLVALAVTLSRNVWMGALAGVSVLLILRRRSLIGIVLAALMLGLAVTPVRTRMLSIFDPSNDTNRDRISMLKSGAAMVHDHWLTGVGPNMVPREYLAHYKRADAVDPADQQGSTRAHLHNVIVQLAAERGLPALGFWLWFVIAAATGLWQLMRQGPAPALAASGLFAIVAMCIAGLFEHNFGDSEFLILFLGLITLPWAARQSDVTQTPRP